MAVDFVYDSEMLPLFITYRKVRRSRCMCLLFLFSIATFVGLAPVMVYRSLGVPLPDGLRGHRNIQPWMIVSQPDPANGSPAPLEGADVQMLRTTQPQSPETAVEPQTIIMPEAHLHSPVPAQPYASITSSGRPAPISLHPTP